MWLPIPAEDPCARFELCVALRAVRLRVKNIAEDVFTDVLIRNKHTVRMLHDVAAGKF